MTPKTEQVLKQAAEYFDLRIKYVTVLPDSVPGLYDPNSRVIFVNGLKPKADQAFTICHEIGHYVLHVDRPRRNYMPRFLDRSWKSKAASEATRDLRAFLARHFNEEWEADMWGLVLLLVIGASDDLLAILEMYPQKQWMLCLAIAALFLGNLKRLSNRLLP